MFRTLPRLTKIAFAAATLLASTSTIADPITPDMAAQVEAYKALLTKWAAEPLVIATLKDANGRGPLSGMNNAAWDALPDNDQAVEQFRNTPVSALIRGWEKDPHISKIFLRDKAGNLAAAGTKKPFIYNVANRPPFKNAVAGQTWADAQVKKDPSTEEMVVQISAPVIENGQVIGVLHTSVK